MGSWTTSPGVARFTPAYTPLAIKSAMACRSSSFTPGSVTGAPTRSRGPRHPSEQVRSVARMDLTIHQCFVPADMLAPRAKASTSSGCAKWRSIRSRTRRITTRLARTSVGFHPRQSVTHAQRGARNGHLLARAIPPARLPNALRRFIRPQARPGAQRSHVGPGGTTSSPRSAVSSDSSSPSRQAHGHCGRPQQLPGDADPVPG